MEAADWTEVTLSSCEAKLGEFGEIFTPSQCVDLGFFARHLLPIGVCSKTTKSNICLDLENFCLEFAAEIGQVHSLFEVEIFLSPQVVVLGLKFPKSSIVKEFGGEERHLHKT